MDCGRVMGVVRSTRGVYICSGPTSPCFRVFWTAQIRLAAQRVEGLTEQISLGFLRSVVRCVSRAYGSLLAHAARAANSSLPCIL